MHARSKIGDIAVTQDGSGTPIVLLHGYLGDGSLWDRQRAELASRAHVIVPDLRGCGDSTVTPGPYLMESLAGDLAEILDALGIERAVIAGHSLGGYVAMAFFRMYAERVAGLALIASPVEADSDERIAERRRNVEIVERDGLAPIVDASTQQFLGERTMREHPEISEIVRAVIARSSAAAAIAYLEGMSLRVSSEDLLEDIAVPAVIVSGRDDRRVPIDMLAATAAAIAGARFVEIAGCGHMVMLEAPLETTAALADLLDRVASAAQT